MTLLEDATVDVARERDEWMRRAEGWESEAAIATERYNRLATAQPGEPLDMDCGDSSCAFAKTRGGMRWSGTQWENNDQDEFHAPTHFLPVLVLP